MAETSQNPAEQPPVTSEQPPQVSSEKEQQEGQKPDPAEQAKVDIDALHRRIETEKKQKQERAAFLEEQAGSRRDKESWVNNTAQSVSFEGIVKSTISENVEEKFQQSISLVQEAGLNDPTNVGVIKAVAKEIIFDHYTKTGADKDATTSYVETTLLPKITMVMDRVKKLYEAKKYPFQNIVQCWQMLSTFSRLEFMNSGVLQQPSLKETFLMDSNALTFIIMSFEQYLNIQGELTTLSGQEANAAMQAAPAGSEKPDISKLFSEGQLKLTGNVRVVIPADVSTTDQYLKDTIEPQLPATLEAANKEAAISYLISELKKMDPKANETFEFAVNGQITKIDTAAEQTQTEKAKKEAEQQVATATGQSPEASAGILGSLGGFGETIQSLLGSLLATLLPLLQSMGLIDNAEFFMLSEEEKKDADAMKKAMQKLELNLKTLRPLFLDSAETRKVLKMKREKNLDWATYLEKYVSAEETDELKKDQTMKPETISKMLLSPNEVTPAVVAVNQPPETTTPAA
jgi:hypothetical protein